MSGGRRIEIEVSEATLRQPDAESKDGHAATWLRLPDDVRGPLCKLLGTLSLNELKARGLKHDEALRVSDIHTLLL